MDAYKGLKGWFHLRVRSVEAARDALRWLSMAQHREAQIEKDAERAEALREAANLTHDYAEELWAARHHWSDNPPERPPNE